MATNNTARSKATPRKLKAGQRIKFDRYKYGVLVGDLLIPTTSRALARTHRRLDILQDPESEARIVRLNPITGVVSK